MPQHLTGFEHLYLEDSYLLGIAAEGTRLRLRVLFALTGDHSAYAPPGPDEQHCYREGSILIDGLRIDDWKPARPSITVDPDGSLDLGFIDLSADAACYEVSTAWFAMRFQATQLTVALD